MKLEACITEVASGDNAARRVVRKQSYKCGFGRAVFGVDVALNPPRGGGVPQSRQPQGFANVAHVACLLAQEARSSGGSSSSGSGGGGINWREPGMW